MTLRPAVAALFLAAVPAFAHQQPAATPSPAPDHHDRQPDERFTLKTLRGGVHALYGRGGNVGVLVGPEAVLVVIARGRRGAGSLRIDEATSGLGNLCASSSWTSRLLLPQAAARSSS